MRINEIFGDTADEVLDRLDKIRRDIGIYKNTIRPSRQLQELYNLQLESLNIDKVNLDFWIMKDSRIQSIYKRIQDLLKA